MTDIVILGVIAGIPSTLAGIATLVVSLRNSQKVDDGIVKADKIIDKADEIHVLVNSNMSEVKAQLAAALARVEKLETMLMNVTQTQAHEKAST